MKIPAIPISYADAQPLLAAMSGPVAPPKWRGALPITYHIGGGPAKVHLAVSSDWGQKPLYDVVARIKGSEYPDEWVVRGNHRDGWVMGAGDPLSGHTAMLAEAKAIGTLLKSGWHPKRTLIYTSWDGEEPGLLGSTEWAETHAAELQQHAVLYLNSDGNGRGFLRAGGSHSLQKFTNDVASTIKDPETGVSARERRRADMEVAGYDKGASEARKQEAKEAAQGGDLPIEALGSGSDFTPFLQHLGITTLELSYGGEGDQAGVYHSLYDSYDHYVRFGDPGFVYGVLEAKTVGHTILRMVDAQVLPFQFGEFAGTVQQYLNELHALADQKRKNAQELSKLLDSKAFELTSDPTRPLLPPQRETAVPQLDFAPLDSVMSRLKSSAQAYDDLYAKVASGSTKLSKGQAKQLDDLLRGMESMLTNPQGLPGRDWYKHLIYAPGLHTGYGVKTVPGVREAIEESQWDAVATYVHLTADALTAYCDRLDKATAILRQTT
jgi:N-acetylated-alpha-linked acidic dipeptidase